MRTTARFGTVIGALALLACSQSHGTDVDAGRDGDAGVIVEGTCSPAQRASASLDVPRLGLDAVAGAGPWTGAISAVDAAGVDLVLADGSAARFAWEGTSLAGLGPGMSATLRRDGHWTVLEAGSVSLHALSTIGFTGYDIVGIAMTIAGAPPLTLVDDCTFREGSGACGQPPGEVTVYALDVGGAARLRADEQTSGAGFEVFFGGSAQLPGYGGDDCVLEAGFAASIGVRVERVEAATCEAVEREYERVVDDNASCATDADCMISNGQCGVGLGGCYEATSADVSEELEALGRRYVELSCTSGVCDCDVAPPVHCAAGRCTFAP